MSFKVQLDIMPEVLPEWILRRTLFTIPDLKSKNLTVQSKEDETTVFP